MNMRLSAVFSTCLHKIRNSLTAYWCVNKIFISIFSMQLVRSRFVLRCLLPIGYSVNFISEHSYVVYCQQSHILNLDKFLSEKIANFSLINIRNRMF